MNRYVLRGVVGPLVLLVGWGSNDDSTEPTLCGGATFEDPNLEAAVRAELGVGAQEALTSNLISELSTSEHRRPRRWGPPRAHIFHRTPGAVCSLIVTGLTVARGPG